MLARVAHIADHLPNLGLAGDARLAGGRGAGAEAQRRAELCRGGKRQEEGGGETAGEGAERTERRRHGQAHSHVLTAAVPQPGRPTWVADGVPPSSSFLVAGAQVGMAAQRCWHHVSPSPHLCWVQAALQRQPACMPQV